MEKYKIKFIGISYNVIEDKGIVVCKVTAQIPYLSNDQWCLYVDSNVIEAKAIARCNKDDKFDAVKGKKIARAKAEKKIYLKMFKRINKILESGNNLFNDLIDFKTRISSYARHNEGYITRIGESE